MTTSVRNSFMPPGVVNNLQEVLRSRKGNDEELPGAKSDDSAGPPSITLPPEPARSNSEQESLKPVVLVTNADGINSQGLMLLVEALVREDLYNVHVCAPQSDKSVSGHSLTLGETVAVTSAEIHGATAYEVAGTPVDCVSLAFSGALFSTSKPLMVISGINRGSSCGHHKFCSGVVAAAREALICGVPSLSLSLNWKKDESHERHFKDAVTVCVPLIKAGIRDIQTGLFPSVCSLDINIPTSPLENKGLKVTKQSLWRPSPSWQAVSASRHSAAAPFMSNQQSLGIQLAQLSRDASAAGAARRLTANRKNVEIESVGVFGKTVPSSAVKKYFRLEFQEKEVEEVDGDVDFRALENGFVAVTPLSLSPCIEPDAHAAAVEWLSTASHAQQ